MSTPAVGLPTGDALAKVWPRTLRGESDDALVAALLTQTVATPMWELMDRGGRRWRPLIARLCFEAAGGTDGQDALFNVVELLHHGSLVVDDIEDGAEQRRGGPAVHVTHGIPRALNAANAAYFRALESLQELLPDALRLRAMDMLVAELFQAHLGQALDLSLGDAMAAGSVVTAAHYREMAVAKTGALVRMAARLGAIAAGAPRDVEQALGAWASQFGLAYQISDDTSDLDEDALRPGTCRLSYPVLLALERLQAEQRLELCQCLGLTAPRPPDETAGPRLLALVAQSGAMEQARADARELAARAVAALESAAVRERAPLRELTNTWLVGRLG